MATCIGILGGAGVAATNRILTMLEIYYTKNGAVRDYDQPDFIFFQATKTPSRSMFLEGKGESFIPAYTAIAKKLEEAGATEIVMCCNTAHYAIDEIQRAITIPCINLIKEVCKAINNSGATTIALLASEGCLKGKVYERWLEEICPHIQVIYPNASMQKKVTKGICNTKNIHRFDPISSPERPKNIFTAICKELQQEGSEAIILGCTDIGVDYHHRWQEECNTMEYNKEIQDNNTKNIIYIDSLEVLVHTIIQRYNNE